MAELTLEYLQEQLDILSSQLSQLDLDNEQDHGNIINSINDIFSNTPTQADIYNINNNIYSINSNLNNINNKINDIDVNKNEISLLKTELIDIQDNLNENNLEDIQNRINILSLKINNISSIYINKNDFNDKIDEINTKFNNYSLNDDLDSVVQRVENLETKSDISLIANEINNIKSNLSSVHESIEVINSNITFQSNDIKDIRKNINKISLNIDNSISELENRCIVIENDINNCNKKNTNLTNTLSDINCEVNKLKLKCTELFNNINQLQISLLNKIDNNTSNIYKDLNNQKTSLTRDIFEAIKDHNTYNQGHKREFDNIDKRLDEIDGRGGRLDEIQELAEKKWITVLSPEAYKRIPASNIKQDQLYMCIKYSKPYELYIGSVLIAKRNTVKDSGFAYTFPLSF